MMLRPNELLIGDHNYAEHVVSVVDGEQKARGLVPRDFKLHPQGCYGSVQAVDIPLIPRGEWSERIKDKVAQQSQLSDIRLVGNNGQIIPSLDQGNKGYCWAHSTTQGVIIARAVSNQPYVPLSAYAVACVLKNFRDEGGWGALSCDFISTRGVPSQEKWPQQSMSRSNDNPDTWANAALHKIQEGWVDLGSSVYERNLSFDQTISLLLSDVPVVIDLNWWGHSILGLDAVDGLSMRKQTRARSGKRATLQEFELAWGVNEVTGGYGVRILNSWSDAWSDRGMGTLSGSKAIPDGAVAPRAITAAAA
ncbi:MAG: hypothetical protein E6G97_18100 [Alphaproteobacteria bacterium]|nr:MAG: hypothetical protein E6G97_18100 [Alphaproteobacteria bacterium]